MFEENISTEGLLDKIINTIKNIHFSFKQIKAKGDMLKGDTSDLRDNLVKQCMELIDNLKEKDKDNPKLKLKLKTPITAFIDVENTQTNYFNC